MAYQLLQVILMPNPLYTYIPGSLNKFPDFFVWALLLIVHTWNSSPLRSNLLQLQCTCCTVPRTSGRPHRCPLVWACQSPSSQPLSSPHLTHNDSLCSSKGIIKSYLYYREGEEVSWCPSWSNSLWQRWSCGLMHCPGGNATEPIWRVLASSDGISSWTPLKPQHSIPSWLSVRWEPSTCRSYQCWPKKGSLKVFGWICSVWLSWVWKSQHASTGNSVSWSLGHSSRSSFHCPGGNATEPIWRVLASSDGISSWTLLKPQHSIPCWLFVR